MARTSPHAGCEHGFTISRHGSPEVCVLFSHPPNRGRREDRMRAAPAVSCAIRTRNCAHEHTGPAENTRPSLRNGFTAYVVVVLVRRALLPPSYLRSRLLKNLTPASGAGPHDFAVRLRHARLRDGSGHRISPQRS